MTNVDLVFGAWRKLGPARAVCSTCGERARVQREVYDLERSQNLYLEGACIECLARGQFLPGEQHRVIHASTKECRP